MRTLCSSTLIGEALVVLFAALVAMQLTDVSHGALWTVSGIAMVLCVLLCGMITRPGAVAVGWALQLGLIASGFVVPTMFVLGVIFMRPLVVLGALRPQDRRTQGRPDRRRGRLRRPPDPVRTGSGAFAHAR